MIDFQTENVAMPAIDIPKIEKWISAVAMAHERKVGDIVYRFCDDPSILKANIEFLGHDYFTDIITFDYSTRKKISGDILLSLDTVRSNAEMLGKAYDDELLRVIIHGVLHLCGINDKGLGEREIMEAEEDKALSMYQEL